MTVQSAALLVAGLCAFGLVAYLYLRVEPRVPGRGILLGLRCAALLVLVALVANPLLPGTDPAGGPPSTPSRWVVVDPDPALGASVGGRSLHDLLLQMVDDEMDAGGSLARIGLDGVQGTTFESLGREELAERPRSLAEPLLSLAEAGADSLVLLSPLRRSAAELREPLARLPVPLRIRVVDDEELQNAALAEFQLPLRIRTDEELEGELVLAGEGGGSGDSLRVTVTARELDDFEGDGSGEGTLVHESFHPVPPAGVLRSVALRLPPPDTDGHLRYRARVEMSGDGFSPDDERIAVALAGPAESGIVLVSLRPDAEPRILLPVLERATGLAGDGFLRVSGDRFLALGGAEDAGVAVPLDRVLEGARASEILILHGAGGSLPDGLRELVAAHPRVLHLPADPAGAELAGVSVGPARSGSWTPAGTLPASPLAPWLRGVPGSSGGLPPLAGPLPLEDSGTGMVALELGTPGSAETVAGVVLVDGPAGRRVVALARDFWRWGSREGAARSAYRSLWAGAADWLLARPGGADVARTRPERPVLPRGEPIPWVSAASVGDSLSIELRPAADVELSGPFLRLDRVVVDSLGRFRTASLPPGAYRYRVGAAGEAGEETGIFEIEGFQDALLRPPLDPEELQSESPDDSAHEARPDRGTRERPLRTHPAPWILLLVLLSAEWLGRRRAGLR